MIKKLLSSFGKIFTYDYDRRKIEIYLSQSNVLADLENRIKELDKLGVYNKYYI